jgi:arylsulfatase A-like enzyme
MATDSRPNIVFILTDEQHVDAVSCMGSQEPVRTPHADRLAQEGVRFTDAFCCSSICSPSRAALFTGKLPHRFGPVRNNLSIPSGTPNLAGLLRDAGYRLGWSGKWHVDSDSVPTDHGFEAKDFPGYGYPAFLLREKPDPGAMQTKKNYYYEYLVENGYDVPTLSDTQSTFLPEGAAGLIHGRQSGPPQASIPGFVGEEAVRLIRSLSGRRSGDGQPFFLQVNFWGPHNPCYIPEPYFSMYDPQDIPEPASAHETFEGKPTVHKRNSMYWGGYGAPWSYWQQHLARYFGYCTLIDDQVGRIRRELEQLGQWENTLLIFASDHGDMMGRHQLMDKGPFMYDDTYRVPLIIAGPGVEHGVCEEFVYLHDLFPTILQTAHVADLPAMDLAQSLQPLLENGEGWTSRDEVFGEFDEQINLFPQRMVRTRTHKFVFNSSDICELYDLERDPHELQNRIDDPACESVKEDLKARLLAHLTATGDREARRLQAIGWAI